MKLLERIVFFWNGWSAVEAVKVGQTGWGIFLWLCMILIGFLIMSRYQREMAEFKQ